MFENEQIVWVKKFLEQCEDKIYSVMDDISIDYPMDIRNGSKKYEETEHTPFNWTSGFWGGMMWLLYLYTGKEKYRNRAIKCSERMQDALGDNESFYCLDNHDLGFMYSLTSVAHYRIDNDVDSRIRGLHAATMLAGRFNPNGNYIRAWSVDCGLGSEVTGYAIIDCMLNLPLLYWATETTEDPRYAAIAKLHANMAMKEFVKPDGSVYHIVNFNPYTGVVKDYPRGQGYASGTSWSRGQAWGLYGFMMSYIHTHNNNYLDTAKGIADYIIKNMKDFTIVPVDFMQPDEPRIIDSSASATIACGMLELAKALETDGKKYADFALFLLKGLYDDCDFSNKNQAILQNAREFYHGGNNFPIIYADYFLIEALIKCLGEIDFFMW